MGLLDTYNRLVEQQYEAELQKYASAEEAAEYEILAKYAQLADYALAQEFGNNYTEDDVVKLASMFIQSDLQEAAEMEKVAELYEMGQIIGRGIRAELGL